MRSLYILGRRSQALSLLKWSQSDLDHSWTAAILASERHFYPQPRGSSTSNRHNVVSRIRQWFHLYIGVDLLHPCSDKPQTHSDLDTFEYHRLQKASQAATPPVSTSRVIKMGFFRGWKNPAYLLHTPY